MRLFVLVVFACLPIALLGSCSDQVEPSEEGVPQVSIGLTPRETPYLDYAGPGSMSYSTGISTFEVSLQTLSDEPIGRLRGKIYFEDDGEVVEITADVSRPVQVVLLGMVIDETDPTDVDLENLMMPIGTGSVKVMGRFEHTVDW